MQSLYVFDSLTDELLAVLSNKDNDQCPFFDDEVNEELNLDFTFTFRVPSDHPDAVHLVEGNKVVYKDLDGEFQEFQIFEIEDEKSAVGYRIVHAEHFSYELVDNIVEDQRVINGSVSEAMTKALSASRIQPGTIAPLGNGTVNFYYSTGLENLVKVCETYGGELRFRVVLNPSKTRIQDRFVDLVARRGEERGVRFTPDKNLESVKRKVDIVGVKTAVYPRGKGEEIEDTGGFTRKPTIADVVWTTASGKPVNKPAGQEWIGDPVALAQFGRNNGTIHRFVTVDFDTSDPDELIQLGWDYLQQVNTPRATYEVSGTDLEQLGFSHEKVRLGDTVIVIDRDIKPEIKLEARIVAVKRSLSEPENVEFTIGNFIDRNTNPYVDIEKIKQELKDKGGVWDTVTQPITDGDFENTTPATPTNVTVSGLFKNLVVEWDFEGSSYISAYEVYASKTSGFTPSALTLVFRGKTGGYVHPAETNETWYFRVRALNTNGTASSYSGQVSGSTVRIQTPDYQTLSVTTAIIANLAVDEAKIANLAVTNAKIANISADKINAGLVQAQFVRIGSATTFDANYDPSTKAKPQDVLDAEQRAKDYAKPVIDGITDFGFEFGRDFHSSSGTSATSAWVGQTVPSMTVGTPVPSDQAEEGGKVLEVTGAQWIYGKYAIPVNPNRVYRVSFRVRQKTNPTTAGTSNIYAGVATLDKNFASITGGAGTHRWCAGTALPITVADDWQTFTGLITGVGTTADTFRAGTTYVRPACVVNHNAGNGTVEIDYLKVEDVTEIQQLEDIVYEVDLRTTEDSILSTVRQSTSYQNDLQSKANATDLENYASNEDLDNLSNEVDGKIQDVNTSINENLITVYEQISQVDQKADAIDFKFTSSGGVNLLKNSTGFSGIDFWTIGQQDGSPIPNGRWSVVQTEELQAKGVGSGFVLNGIRLDQTISTTPQFHAVSTIVKKGTTGSGFIRATHSNGVVQQINFNAGTEYDFEKVSMILEPTGAEILIQIYATDGSDCTFTGTMVNVGNVALQWQHSAGEIYNTNVLMDLNGVRVISNVYEGYTAITPQEFSGYAMVNGVMTRVFTLNRDVTEVSKLRVEKEIVMGGIKILPVNNATYEGWAFVINE